MTALPSGREGGFALGSLPKRRLPVEVQGSRFKVRSTVRAVRSVRVRFRIRVGGGSGARLGFREDMLRPALPIGPVGVIHLATGGLEDFGTLLPIRVRVSDPPWLRLRPLRFTAWVSGRGLGCGIGAQTLPPFQHGVGRLHRRLRARPPHLRGMLRRGAGIDLPSL